jgi:hypothetical protein
MFENIMKEIGLFIVQEYVPIATGLTLYPAYDNLHNNGLCWHDDAGLWLGSRPLPRGVRSRSGQHDVVSGVGPSRRLRGLERRRATSTASTKAQIASNYLAGGTNAVPAT